MRVHVVCQDDGVEMGQAGQLHPQGLGNGAHIDPHLTGAGLARLGIEDDLHADLDAADQARQLDGGDGGDGGGGDPTAQDTFDSEMAQAVDERTPFQRCLGTARQYCLDLMEWGPFSGAMLVATFWALFMDDVRIATMPKSADLGMSVVDGIVFFLFLLELLLQSFARYASRSYSCPSSSLHSPSC